MNTQTISLDVTKAPAITPVLRLGQGDANGTTLVAKIYDNGEPLTLTSYGVRFRMKLPRGYAEYHVDGTVSGSTATFTIDESYAASVAGVTDTAYVEVLSGDTVICSTNRMRVVVLESAYEGTDPAHIWSNGVEEFLEESEAEVDAFIAGAQSDIDAALEAVGDISELAVPLMSSTTRGGAKVGFGLEVEDGELASYIAKSSTGESVTAGNASALESLTIYGKSVQDGTPTPSSPVPVQVVEGANLYDIGAYPLTNNRYIISTSGNDASSSSGNAATLDYIPCSNFAGRQVTLNRSPVGTGTTPGFAFYDSSKEYISGVKSNGSTQGQPWTITVPANAVYMRFTSQNDADDVMLNIGDSSLPYTPYGAIGINVGGTVTPIDLQGNVLASLPDGTRDELSIDSTGAVTLIKRTFMLEFDGSDMSGWSIISGNHTFGQCRTDVTSANSVILSANNSICSSGVYTAISVNNTSFGYSNTTRDIRFRPINEPTIETLTTYLQNNPTQFVLPLKEPQTIDLGYIDMPDIASGAAISVTASVTPTIAASWWAEGAKEVSDAIRALKRAIFENVGNALASSIATVEGETSAHNYSAGSYLMQGEQLYKVTSAIASGEEITPGTNVTATTVMAELLALTA